VKLEIEIDIGDEAVDKRRLEAHLRKEAVLSLFAEGKMTVGRANRALGLTRLQFMDLLQERSIPIVDYTVEDFDKDLKAVEQLWPEIERNVQDSGARRIG
jgi:predicted HTH domain antitoxin